MQGEITASSVENQGSCFKFTALLQESDACQIVIPQVDISRLHILVVDDNATNCGVLKGQLSHWGAKVSVADCAKQALILCEHQHRVENQLFDIALLDMQMPDIDGAEF